MALMTVLLASFCEKHGARCALRGATALSMHVIARERIVDMGQSVPSLDSAAAAGPSHGPPTVASPALRAPSWETPGAIPYGSGELFLSGVAAQFLAGLPGGINTVTWTGTWASTGTMRPCG
jgi:hypothetical protein